MNVADKLRKIGIPQNYLYLGLALEDVVHGLPFPIETFRLFCVHRPKDGSR